MCLVSCEGYAYRTGIGYDGLRAVFFYSSLVCFNRWDQPDLRWVSVALHIWCSVIRCEHPFRMITNLQPLLWPLRGTVLPDLPLRPVVGAHVVILHENLSKTLLVSFLIYYEAIVSRHNFQPQFPVTIPLQAMPVFILLRDIRLWSKKLFYRGQDLFCSTASSMTALLGSRIVFFSQNLTYVG